DLLAGQRRTTVSGVAQAVEYTAQEVLTDPYAKSLARSDHGVTGAESVDIAERHAPHSVGTQTDDLGRNTVEPGPRGEQHKVADRGVDPSHLDHEADDRADPSDPVRPSHSDRVLHALGQQADHVAPGDRVLARIVSSARSSA